LARLGHPSKFQRVSHLGSVTAWHSSSGRQPNFAALNRGRHLYSPGRPSPWALAHILVFLAVSSSLCHMQLLTATHRVYESRLFIHFNADVDIHNTKFSNLVVLSYIVASKKSIRYFIITVLQASAEIPCCLVYRSSFKR